MTGLRRAVLVVFPLMVACGVEPIDDGKIIDDQVADEAKLAAGKDVFATLQGTSWYGEVKGVYRACFTFSPLNAQTPWAAQTISFWVNEGPEVSSSKMTLSRYSPANAGPALSVLRVDEPVAGATPVFPAGEYLQGVSPKANDHSFWRRASINFGGQLDDSAFGVQLAIERTTLRVAAFGSQSFCTPPDGTTSECGSGGYRPFLTKRVSSCPAP